MTSGQETQQANSYNPGARTGARKRCILGTKFLWITNRKPYLIYRMVPLSMTLSDPDTDFKVTTFFDIEYFWKDMRESHSNYRTSIGSHMRSIKWWYFQWPWRTPNQVFKVTELLLYHIWSQISRKLIVLWTKFLWITNREPYLIYRMVQLSMTLSDLWLTQISRSQHFWSWIL